MTVLADDPRLKVLEGMTLSGSPNLSETAMAAQIAHAIRQGFPQVKPSPERPDRIALVGSGPSLAETEEELRELVFAGAFLVTLNGAYHWAIEHNFHPKAQIVMDGRATNTRFVMPAVPRCKYFLASQCHPDMWEAVRGRPETYIFHAVTNDGIHAPILDGYYGAGRWVAVTGGTTVASRAIALLRTGGFVRFDLFGIDSCWLDGAHHALPQVENDADRRIRTTCAPSGYPDLAKTFDCAPWHLKQIEDFLQFLRFNGQHFLLNVHGPGLLAHVMTSFALAGEIDLQQQGVPDGSDGMGRL